MAESDPVKIQDGLQKISVRAIEDSMEGKQGEDIGYLQLSIYKMEMPSDSEGIQDDTIEEAKDES